MFKLIIILMAAMLLAGCIEEGIGNLGSQGSNYASGSHNPEPSSLALLGVGLAGLAVATVRKRKKSDKIEKPTQQSTR